MTKECLAAVLGPDLWPPTSWEDHSLITDNYYEPDALRESGKKYCYYGCSTWPHREFFKVLSMFQCSLKKHWHFFFFFFINLMRLSKTFRFDIPVVHQQWRNVTFLPERDLRGSLSESRRDLLVISFDFHVQSGAKKVLQFREGRPPRCLSFFMCTGTRFTGGYQQSQSRCESGDIWEINSPDRSYKLWLALDLFIHSYLVSNLSV